MRPRLCWYKEDLPAQRTRSSAIPTHHCECGARHKFPDRTVGRRARCRRCGVVFLIEADDDELVFIDEDKLPQLPKVADGIQEDAPEQDSDPEADVNSSAEHTSGLLQTFSQPFKAAFLFLSRERSEP